jgi:LuxR family maltose regulon positive regulatory protein
LRDHLTRLDDRTIPGTVAELDRSGPAVLVLDAFDALTDEALVADLAALTERPYGTLRVVVVARSLHAPQLHHIRRRRDVGYLGHEDLAFTRREAELLIRRVADPEPEAAQVTELVERTRGWPVALRVGALGLRRTPGAAETVRDLSGEDPHIAAVLWDEVLAGLSPSMRRFLVSTSVADTLTGPLCDAVNGRAGGAVMLRLLEQSGVLIQADRGRKGTFTYHPMLRDLLRRELRALGPTAESEALKRAARWHVAHGDGDVEVALRLLMEADDWDAALEIVDQYGRSAFEGGRVVQVLALLEHVPASSRRDLHEVVQRRALLHAALGQTRQAEQLLRERGAVDPSAPEQAIDQALRATWVFIDGSPLAALRSADAALDALRRLDDGDLPDLLGLTSRASLTMMAVGSRARALWSIGDLDGSRKWFRRARDRPDPYPPWLVHTCSALALLEAWAGNLGLALRHAGDAFRVAASTGLRAHPALLDAHLARGHVYRERGELLRAKVELDSALAIASRTRRPVTRAVHVIERAQWHLAAGDPEAGLRALQRHRATGEAVRQPLIERNLLATELRLLLAVGKVEQVRALLAAVAPPRPPELATAAVLAALAADSPTVAGAELDQWPRGPEPPRAVLERRLLTAIVELRAGRRQHAVRLGRAMLDRAEREGHVRLVLDMGGQVELLLRAVLQHAPSPYVHGLAVAAAEAARPRTFTAAGLSERELEVARYLPTPLSNAEIAARLYVSLNTLKTHLRSIYRKLGAQGRRDASRRAEELGIA